MVHRRLSVRNPRPESAYCMFAEGLMGLFPVGHERGHRLPDVFFFTDQRPEVWPVLFGGGALMVDTPGRHTRPCVRVTTILDIFKQYPLQTFQ